MADVYVNALTTISTEPTTTDSLVAVNRNTNEGKIIDYNLLADVILNKIASKQFSGLTTTSKLLTGAINELDSDVGSLNSRTNYPCNFYTFYKTASGSLSVQLGSASCTIFFVGRGGSSNTKYALGVINVATTVSVYNLGTDELSATLDAGTNVLTITLTGNYARMMMMSNAEMSDT